MRQFTKPTFLKWQKEKERDCQTLSWLRCVLVQDKLHIDTLFAKSAKCSLRNFSNSWIKGSTNLKLSNMLDHARSDIHLAAMSTLRADLAKDRSESVVLSTPLSHSFANLDEVALTRLKLKCDISYLMDKQC